MWMVDVSGNDAKNGAGAKVVKRGKAIPPNGLNPDCSPSVSSMKRVKK